MEEEVKPRERVLAIYGEMPEEFTIDRYKRNDKELDKETKKKAEEWLDKLLIIRYTVAINQEELHPYLLKEGGPIIRFERNIGGFLEVKLCVDKILKKDLDREELDEMYRIIVKEAEERGISNIPVAFELSAFRYNFI